MQLFFFETPQQRNLFYPIALTRPIAKMNIGLGTIAEKWLRYYCYPHFFLTSKYLQETYPATKDSRSPKLFINSTVLPNDLLVKAISCLQPGQKLIKNHTLIACLTDGNQKSKHFQKITFDDHCIHLQSIHDCFLQLETIIKEDIDWIQKKKKTAHINDPHTIVYHPKNIFLEKNTCIRQSTLNAIAGPIYIGKNVTIQENSVLQGPLIIQEGTIVNAGAHILSSSIGPYNKIGGEVKESIMLGYSNKPHAGFLGNSIIGEWCNIGGGTDTSNLKNNYNTLKVWHHGSKKMLDTHLLFLGTLMGDHSKCGIHTTLNAGTVIGVNTSICQTQYFDRYVPSFTWMTPQKTTKYQWEKALTTAQKMMERKNCHLTAKERHILQHIFINNL